LVNFSRNEGVFRHSEPRHSFNISRHEGSPTREQPQGAPGRCITSHVTRRDHLRAGKDTLQEDAGTGGCRRAVIAIA
jgi:hypothetical protein